MCFEHIFPIYVWLSSVGYLHVFLKSLPHFNELYWMHLTLETTVLEEHPKNPQNLKTKPHKTRDHYRHLFPQALWLAGREGQGKQVFQENLQCQSLQSPSYLS